MDTALPKYLCTIISLARCRHRTSESISDKRPGDLRGVSMKMAIPHHDRARNRLRAAIEPPAEVEIDDFVVRPTAGLLTPRQD